MSVPNFVLIHPIDVETFYSEPKISGPNHVPNAHVALTQELLVVEVIASGRRSFSDLTFQSLILLVQGKLKQFCVKGLLL